MAQKKKITKAQAKEMGKQAAAQNPELGRRLTLIPVVALGIGATVGSGIFSSLQEVALASGSALFLVLSFVIGGLLQIPSNLCYAELASAYPEDGAHYIYFREAGSRPLAFLCGWMSYWAIDPPSVAVMELAIVNHVLVFCPLPDIGQKFLAAAIDVTFMCIHLRSVKGGGIINTILTAVKILPFLFIVGFGAFYINQNLFLSPQPLDTAAATGNLGIVALLAGVSATTWSYDGMAAACYMSGEIKNPKKTIPRALIITAIIVLSLYAVLTTVSTGLLSIDELAESTAPIALLAGKLPVIGPYAENIVAVMIILVILGSVSSCIMCQPRIEYAMAKDGLFFNIFGKVHKSFNTPYVAIMMHSALSIFLIFASNLNDILGYFTIVALLRNFGTFGTIFVLRRKSKKDYNPSYRAPLGYTMPVIAMLMTLTLIISTFAWAPLAGIIASAVTVGTGLPAFFFWDRKNNSKKEG